jgi:hypothetical protein
MAMGNNLIENKNIYKNTKISVEADNKIRNVLENLPETKAKKKFSIKAATIIFICIASLLLTTVFPVEASSLLKKAFGYFIKEKKLSENYDKYAGTVNKTSKDNGIEVTIDSIVSDALGITLGYTVKTEKLMKGAQLDINKVLVNGKEISFENSSGYYEECKNSQYAGYQFLKIKNLPEKFKFEIIVSGVGIIKGQWNFKLDTSNTEINKNTFITSSQVQKSSDNGTLNISKVISSPLMTYIQLTFKSNEAITSNEKIPYTTVFLLDENNRMITADNVSNKVMDEHTYLTEFYINRDNTTLNKLTIIPYKAPEISKAPRKLEDDNEFYNLKSKTPFIINAGELGKITINTINETKGNVTLSCSTESIYGDWIINSLGLGYDIKLNAKPGIYNFNTIFYNKNTIENLKSLTNFKNVVLEYDKEPGLSEDKYMVVFQKYIKEIKIYPELKITIPIE